MLELVGAEVAPSVPVPADVLVPVPVPGSPVAEAVVLVALPSVCPPVPLPASPHPASNHNAGTPAHPLVRPPMRPSSSCPSLAAFLARGAHVL